MMINEMVQIYNGNNSMGGMFIYTGTVAKVNKKSIRVHMTHVKYTTEYDINETATFDFWKTIDRQFGENAGKTVDIYKNSKYGIIEVVH